VWEYLQDRTCRKGLDCSHAQPKHPTVIEAIGDVGQPSLYSDHNCPYFNGECLCTKDEKIRRRARDKQQPTPSNSPNSKPIEERYIVDWGETRYKQYKKGLETYNTPLMTHNGRDAGQDALDELVDAGRYITQLRMEKEALEARVRELENTIENLHDVIAGECR